MILTSTSETMPYTPPWRVSAAKPPVYHLRAAGVIERAQMEAELSGPYRAGRVYGFELRAAIRAGILVLLEGDPEQERVLALIDAEGQDDHQVTLSEDDTRLVTGVRAILAENWPDYRDLVAQLERRREIAPIVALRRYCTGWDNCVGDSGKEAAFARGRDGLVTDAALSGLATIDMMAAGNQAYALQYGAGQEGNSPPPSVSGDGPATSSSDEPSKAAGRSKKPSGKKTPA